MSFLKNPLFISFALFIIVAILAVLFYPLFFQREETKAPSPTASDSFVNRYDFLKQKWSKEMNTFGGKEAYARFKVENFKTKLSSQHDMAHIFGELLYDKYQIDGLEFCDDSFIYACYHSLLGRAIEIEGVQASNKFIQKCDALTGNVAISSCHHGMGHGYVANYGYHENNLNSALDQCSTLNSRNPLDWCTSGVFMEYNYQLMHGGNKSTRSYDEKSPLQPCESIKEAYQPGCYFQQTQWWLVVIPGSDSDKVTQIISMCSQLQLSQDEINQCFKGIGEHIGYHVKWDVAKVKPLCELFDSDLVDGCLINAARVFKYAQYPDKANSLCHSLSDNDSQTKCTASINSVI